MTEIRDFPPIIRRALARATGCDGCGLRDLTGMERMLLSRYIRNVNIRDVRKSVRVSTLELSLALHVSDRTLLRIKTELIAKGWLVTHQVQSRRRGMQISDVSLTERALAVLGLLEANDQPSASAKFAEQVKDVEEKNDVTPDLADAFCFSQSFTKSHSHREPVEISIQTEKMDSDGVVTPPEPEQVDQKVCEATFPPLDIEVAQQPVQANEAEPELGYTHTTDIPADLAVLERGGLNRFAIFKLMGKATRKGKRLSDIVKAMSRETLLGAKNLYSYMVKLLDIDRDWKNYKAPAVARHEAKMEAIQRSEALGAAMRAITKACAITGALTNSARETYWKVENGVVYAWKAINPAGLARVLEIEKMAEALKAGRIFPTTVEVCESHTQSFASAA